MRCVVVKLMENTFQREETQRKKFPAIEKLTIFYNLWLFTRDVYVQKTFYTLVAFNRSNEPESNVSNDRLSKCNAEISTVSIKAESERS